MHIPPTVEAIDDSCFEACTALTAVEFDAVLQLHILNCGLFLGCRALTSIRIPSCVEQIENQCFDGCSSLSSVVFESDSRLRDISSSAFPGAYSLHLLELPSSLELVWLCCHREGLVRDRSSMRSLTFAPPSRLCELSLSLPTDFGGDELDIPASTRIVEFELTERTGPAIVVNFDRESRLEFFESRRPEGDPATSGIFWRFSEGSLKRFRDSMNLD
jgi:hypothetical protein